MNVQVELYNCTRSVMFLRGIFIVLSYWHLFQGGIQYIQAVALPFSPPPTPLKAHIANPNFVPGLRFTSEFLVRTL